jgi:hypothetical protein
VVRTVAECHLMNCGTWLRVQPTVCCGCHHVSRDDDGGSGGCDDGGGGVHCSMVLCCVAVA